MSPPDGIEHVVHRAVREELDEVVPHLLAALKRDRAFDAIAARLDDAERRLEARRERPVVVAVHRVLNRLRHLDVDPDAKAALDDELVAVLRGAGYDEIGVVGEPFDLDRHEPLEGETLDGRGTVAHVFARGLTCFGQVVARARVRVAASPADDEEGIPA